MFQLAVVKPYNLENASYQIVRALIVLLVEIGSFVATNQSCVASTKSEIMEAKVVNIMTRDIKQAEPVNM
jgi:hypothetical protein